MGFTPLPREPHAPIWNTFSNKQTNKLTTSHTLLIMWYFFSIFSQIERWDSNWKCLGYAIFGGFTTMNSFPKKNSSLFITYVPLSFCLLFMSAVFNLRFHFNQYIWAKSKLESFQTWDDKLRICRENRKNSVGKSSFHWLIGIQFSFFLTWSSWYRLAEKWSIYNLRNSWSSAF